MPFKLSKLFAFTCLVTLSTASYAVQNEACADRLSSAGDELSQEITFWGYPRGVYSFGPRQQEVISIIEGAAVSGKSLVGAISLAMGDFRKVVPFAGKILETKIEDEPLSQEKNFKFLVESATGKSWFILSAGRMGSYGAYGKVYEVQKVDSFKPYSRKSKINPYVEKLFSDDFTYIVSLTKDGSEFGTRVGVAVGEIGYREEFVRYEYYLGGFWSRKIVNKITFLPFTTFYYQTEDLALDPKSRATIYKVQQAY